MAYHFVIISLIPDHSPGILKNTICISDRHDLDAIPNKDEMKCIVSVSGKDRETLKPMQFNRRAFDILQLMISQRDTPSLTPSPPNNHK